MMNASMKITKNSIPILDLYVFTVKLLIVLGFNGMNISNGKERQ